LFDSTNGPDGRSHQRSPSGPFAVSAVMAESRPLDLQASHGFTDGAPLMITWPDENGINAVPAELVASRTEGAVGLWVVQVVGAPWREQRRAFVRVAIMGPIKLTVLAAGPAADTLATKPVDATPDIARQQTTGPSNAATSLSSRLIDLSEAAVRCALPTAGIEAVQPGTSVTVDFHAGDRDFSLPGTVLKLADSQRQAGRTEAVVTFAPSEEKASAIRRTIFAEQIKIRRVRSG
jgi:hypothetical protein